MADPSDTMSVMANYTAGLNNVGSYQVAGRPYISGSDAHHGGLEKVYEFPTVTNSIRITNFSSVKKTTEGLVAADFEEIRVHFNPTGSSSGVIGAAHYQILSGSIREVEMNVKCRRIYVSAPDAGSDRSYRIVASLTQIPAQRMYELTGSGLTDSV
jgi:hypothetical protein|tara:strand:+ start:469 stop:936 length:468 start_codon:yes stop_codon:yes gene_type:complete